MCSGCVKLKNKYLRHMEDVCLRLDVHTGTGKDLPISPPLICSSVKNSPLSYLVRCLVDKLSNKQFVKSTL